MAKFTEKQQRFIDGKVGGLNNKDAALAAGYAPTAVGVQASQLMVRPEIKAAIKAGKKASVAASIGVDKPGEDEDRDTSMGMRTDYATSLEMFQHAYNNPRLPIGLRLDAAKQALPYEHGRIGEKGKKESKVDTAKETAKGKFKPKLAPGPPQLRMVN